MIIFVGNQQVQNQLFIVHTHDKRTFQGRVQLAPENQLTVKVSGVRGKYSTLELGDIKEIS